MLDDLLAQALVRDVRGVLGRHHDGLDPHRLAVDVADAHLRLAVGPEVRERPVPADLGEAAHQAVGQRDRRGHELRRLVARVPEHEALVARAQLVGALVDSLGDVRGLLVDGDDHAAGVGVEAVLGARVPHVPDGLARDVRDVHVAGGRDLAGHDDETGGEERLARHPAPRILGEDGVQDGIRDLVRDLVGVTLGDRLRGEQVLVVRHLALLNGLPCGRVRRGASPQPGHFSMGRNASQGADPVFAARRRPRTRPIRAAPRPRRCRTVRAGSCPRGRTGPGGARRRRARAWRPRGRPSPRSPRSCGSRRVGSARRVPPRSR